MSQVVECASCGRAAIVICPTCTKPGGRQVYTADQIEEAILRWCGWPDQTIENVRHAMKMEACGGLDGPAKPPETSP
jgi:hypothetical protein